MALFMVVHIAYTAHRRYIKVSLFLVLKMKACVRYENNWKIR